MSRRVFITLLGAVASWPLAVCARDAGYEDNPLLHLTDTLTASGCNICHILLFGHVRGELA
jgi:hypothetical protein